MHTHITAVPAQQNADPCTALAQPLHVVMQGKLQHAGADEEIYSWKCSSIPVSQLNTFAMLSPLRKGEARRDERGQEG